MGARWIEINQLVGYGCRVERQARLVGKPRTANKVLNTGHLDIWSTS
jgi:hypothetical protein